MIKLIKDDSYIIPNLDGCGNTTVIVLEINGVYIPLCSNCVDELKDEVDNYEEE